MPGHLTWKFGERLLGQGVEIINGGISGAVHQDRKLRTGDFLKIFVPITFSGRLKG